LVLVRALSGLSVASATCAQPGAYCKTPVSNATCCATDARGRNTTCGYNPAEPMGMTCKSVPPTCAAASGVCLNRTLSADCCDGLSCMATSDIFTYTCQTREPVKSPSAECALVPKEGTISCWDFNHVHCVSCDNSSACCNGYHYDPLCCPAGGKCIGCGPSLNENACLPANWTQCGNLCEGCGGDTPTCCSDTVSSNAWCCAAGETCGSAAGATQCVAS